MRQRFALSGLALLLLVGGGAAWARSRAGAPTPALYTTALGQIPAALAVAPGGRVFAISGKGATSSVLDAATGEIVATVPVHGGAAVVDARASTVLVAGDAGVTMLDVATGRVRRVVPLSVAPDSIAVDPRAGHAFVVDPGSDTARMLDTRTGAVVRTVSLVMTPSAVAVDARAGQVYVTSDSPFVDVLDTRSGAAVRTVVMRTAPGRLTVDTGSGRAFVVDAGATTVTMLDMRGGGLPRTTTVAGGVVALALDARRERAYVVSRDGGESFATTVAGTLTVLDARDGSIIKTYSVGFNPTAVAVDEGSGRIFIASGASAAVEPDRWRWLPDPLRAHLPFLPPPGPRLRVTPPGVTALDPRS